MALKPTNENPLRRGAWVVCLVASLTRNLCLGDLSSAEPSAFDFAHEISPLLAKTGCAAAECHGAATGQGGFKLSLFAGDPRADYEAIRNELGGRRLDFVVPQTSLFLRKPARDIKHGGGRILKKSDIAYQSLLAWVRAGAPFRVGLRAELSELELRRSGNQLQALATFQTDAGPSVRDVTSLALLESTNEQVAALDAGGKITQHAPGEAWALARYAGFSARLPIREAFSESAFEADALFEDSHSLDRVWQTRLNELGLAPAPASPPHTLVRRLYLDLAGRPPAPHEINTFMGFPAKLRMSKTVDKLLSSSEFSGVFGQHVASWFEVPEPGKDDRNGIQRNTVLRKFFRDSVARGDSLEKITRAVLTESNAQQAWRHLGDPRDRAEFIGRATLGISISCARCHNHPMDRWRQREHLQFSAYFADPRPAANGMMMAGQFFLPGEGRPVAPALLPLAEEEPPGGLSFEKEVAWFVLDGAREQFARNFANRIFGVMVGKPLVSSPDDHRLSNPAIHEPLLDYLAGEFVKKGTDVRALVKLIATSRLYAMASEPPNPANLSGDPELPFIARREARPLSPRQTKRAIDFVLGVEIDRAAPPESPLARQLYIMNSGLVQAGLNTPGNQVEAVFDFQPNPIEQLKELYLLILSRPPREAEQQAFVPVLKNAKNPAQAGRELAFALIASREFGSLR